MITTVHFLVGGAVGVITGNPYAAVAAGFVSHFVCDAIPHLDVSPDAPRKDDEDIIFTPALWGQVWVDGLVGIAVALYFWGRLDSFSLVSPFIWGAFGGFLPDLIDNVPFWNQGFRATWFGKTFHRIHESTHELWQKLFPMRRFWWLGVITQLVTVALAVYSLVN